MKKLLFISALLLVVQSVSGQGSISVQAPKAVALDEQFNLTFTVNDEKPESFQWDCPPDFKLVWGPQTGSSTSISMVNGKTTKTVTHSYTYILMPVKEGEFTIPAASAKTKKSTLSSKPFSIKVAKGGASSASSRPSSSNAYSISSEDIFLRMTLSSREAVVGQPITATIKLYERVGVAGFEDVRFPSFDGFWSQALEAPSNVNFQRETVGDEIYNAAVLRSFSIIPQQAGDLEIDPAELVCLVRVRNNRSGAGSILDSFFQDEYSTVRKRVSTKPVTVHVRPLPQPQPASFCGGVGKFSISASMSCDSLAAHEAASLTLAVRGTGNISLIDAPAVKFPADFEVYDPKITDKGDSKVFEYPFIPRHHGDFTIGPVEFSYYDTDASRYVTLTTEAMPLRVSKASGVQESGPAQGGFVGVSGRDVKDLGSDIRYIFTGKSSLHRAGQFFVLSPLFFVILVLLLVLALVIFLVSRGAAARRADVAGERRRGASKMARKRLSGAESFEQLHKALLGFVADKLGMDASEQDKDTICARLAEEGASQADADEFAALLVTCEYARYSPDSGSDALKSSYDAALRLITSLDDAMRKNKHNRKGAAGAVIALLMLAPGLKSSAADADSLWRAGINAYAEGNWTGARASWESIASDGYISAELCYNLGCACFKDGDLAHSILWYERALKLDPSYKDARHNLEYARSFTQDRIESVPEFFLTRWLRSVRAWMSSDAWAVLALVLLALFLAMLLLFLLADGPARITGFFVGILMLLLCAGAFGFSLSSRARSLDADRLVITVPVSVARSAPDQSSGTDLFILHEGSSAVVTDEVGEWAKIEISDGRQGWILKTEYEII